MEINRTKQRIDKTGEVFTSTELVNEILDKVPRYFFTDCSKTICEPSVGEGVFLVEILKRRIENNLDPIESLSTLYGVDLMPDNVEACRKNLLSIVGNNEKTASIVNNNIVCANSLEFDFNFNEENNE